MTEKTTSHVFWFFITAVSFCLAHVFGIIAVICWLCAVSNTRKHNAKVAERRHQETLTAIRSGIKL